MESKHALLVDAFGQASDFMTEILNDAGYNVKVTLTEKEALFELFKKENFFDLIITHVDLPGSHSINFIKMTRNEARHKKTPIIAVTNEFTKSGVEACIEAGATDLLINPFDSSDLKKVIRLCAPF